MPPPAKGPWRYSRTKASGTPGRRGLVTLVDELAVVVVAVERSGFSRWHAMRSMSCVESGENLGMGERVIRNGAAPLVGLLPAAAAGPPTRSSITVGWN